METEITDKLEEFDDWLQSLPLQTLTDELKSEIFDKVSDLFS